MVIAIQNNTNIIVGIGEGLGYTEYSYPIINSLDTIYPPTDFIVQEISNIPSNVESFKYCYTKEDGFYPNPNWAEPNPYRIPNELYNQIIDDYTEELINDGIY